MKEIKEFSEQMTVDVLMRNLILIPTYLATEKCVHDDQRFNYYDEDHKNNDI